MKVYLDTNIISNLYEDHKNKIPQKELDALECIVDRDDIQLVTSEKSHEEISHVSDKRRKQTLKVLYKIIQKVNAPPHTTHYSGLMGDIPMGAVLMGGGPGTVIDGIYSSLCAIFTKDDSEHIYIAAKSGCNFFMTLDFQSLLRKIIKHPEQIEKIISPMKMGTPSQLLARIL